MRVYVPASLDLLADWLAAATVPWPPDAIVADDDDEESEYSALMAAADESAELIGRAGRRVVVVAEVATEGGPIPMRQVVAAHADVTDFTDPDDDLAWFATQEIPDLF
ncbi:hypothetical protein NSZ01_25970 [Nocardioides szechwanensis]|uniref:Uncharacterized protein n=1 Tax=Nocardioides szechwanensis TaxID=1005944 RepID=A0A1H0AKE1_9ACTN|nr:hypothetical protein [Nocardioides szechwanensis]GEP34829.1 hypothetical protein NSZ01_25970 [Nocardioides szechwanensis]SDN33917.1 hypothetical protein SAMN05192576_2064 [Nocardioides szechwanensis]